MAVEQFESISLTVGIGGLIAYMFYIMYRLAKDSGAGRIGSLAIFLSLGLGMLGFVAKSVIQLLIEV